MTAPRKLKPGYECSRTALREQKIKAAEIMAERAIVLDALQEGKSVWYFCDQLIIEKRPRHDNA